MKKVKWRIELEREVTTLDSMDVRAVVHIHKFIVLGENNEVYIGSKSVEKWIPAVNKERREKSIKELQEETKEKLQKSREELETYVETLEILKNMGFEIKTNVNDC